MRKIPNISIWYLHVHMHECKSGAHEDIHIHTEKKEKGGVEWSYLKGAIPNQTVALRQGWKGNEGQGWHLPEQRASLLEHSEGKGQATQKDMGSVQKSKAAGCQWGNLTWDRH